MSLYRLKISKTEENLSGDIPGDNIPVGSDSYFLSSFQGIYFSVTLSFILEEDNTGGETFTTVTGQYNPTNITYVLPVGVSGLTVQKINQSTIKILGPGLVSFNETMTFLMRDSSVRTLTVSEASTFGGFKSIIGWTPPSNPEKLVSYLFSITFNRGTPSIRNASFNQYFYWKFDSSLNTFEQLLQKGVRI